MLEAATDPLINSRRFISVLLHGIRSQKYLLYLGMTNEKCRTTNQARIPVSTREVAQSVTLLYRRLSIGEVENLQTYSTIGPSSFGLLSSFVISYSSFPDVILELTTPPKR